MSDARVCGKALARRAGARWFTPAGGAPFAGRFRVELSSSHTDPPGSASGSSITEGNVGSAPQTYTHVTCNCHRATRSTHAGGLSRALSARHRTRRHHASPRDATTLTVGRMSSCTVQNQHDRTDVRSGVTQPRPDTRERATPPPPHPPPNTRRPSCAVVPCATHLSLWCQSTDASPSQHAGHTAHAC